MTRLELERRIERAFRAGDVDGYHAAVEALALMTKGSR